MLHPAWLNAGITSRRKLTGAGRSMFSTVRGAVSSVLPSRAMTAVVPSRSGTIRPFGEIEAIAGSLISHSTDRVASLIEPSAARLVAIICWVARRTSSRMAFGSIVISPAVGLAAPVAARLVPPASAPAIARLTAIIRAWSRLGTYLACMGGTSGRSRRRSAKVLSGGSRG